MEEPRSEAATIAAVAARYRAGELAAWGPLGSGHIHETFFARLRTAGGEERELVLQRMNETVFPDLGAVMENLERIAAHPDLAGFVPALLRTAEGESVVHDEGGRPWRAFDRITGTVSFDEVDDPELVRAAARAFGEFVQRLATLAGPPLREPLPGFHDTRARYAAFEAAVARDSFGRAGPLRPEIAALRERGELTELLVPGELPLRVTHNDTKINNVLFEKGTRRAVAVVDLDTVTPGLLAWDFGDLVRSATNPVAEDSPDPGRATLRCDLFAALARGWFEGAGPLMTPDEHRSLVPGGLVMTYELALRFATDFLEGDRYFRTRDDQHNLRRIRVQLQMLASMEGQRAELEAIIAEQKATPDGNQ